MGAIFAFGKLRVSFSTENLASLLQPIGLQCHCFLVFAVFHHAILHNRTEIATYFLGLGYITLVGIHHGIQSFYRGKTYPNSNY